MLLERKQKHLNTEDFEHNETAPLMPLQFHEADELHRQQEAHLRARLEQLEKDSEQHQAVVDGLAFKYTDAMEKLQSDKARLEVSLDDSAPKMIHRIGSHVTCLTSLCFVDCGAGAGERSQGVSTQGRGMVLNIYIYTYIVASLKHSTD